MDEGLAKFGNWSSLEIALGETHENNVFVTVQQYRVILKGETYIKPGTCCGTPNQTAKVIYRVYPQKIHAQNKWFM